MPEPYPTILLIEDDQNTRELYYRELKRDFKVLTSNSESETLDLLNTHTVCAIILEPALRHGQGWALLENLHLKPQTRAIPIILCSTLDERRLGLELGATRYLTKPVLPNTLLGVIHQVLNNSVNS
ncbi:MAG: putative two-component response regulator [Chloroflexi bacterium]|nr:putative two-component response regulator [Chloroflexota bacterium]